MKNNYTIVYLDTLENICSYCHVRNLCEKGVLDEIGDENNISDVIDLIYLCRENSDNAVIKINGARREYLDCRGSKRSIFSITSRAVEIFSDLNKSAFNKDELIKYLLNSKSFREVKEKIRRKFLSIGVELHYISD